jgi:L-alanine-DL-glutamate epimerase-like enolase superfamily enzyme
VAVVTKAEAFLVNLEVEQTRTDAVQAFLAQETVFVEVTADDGAVGLGYSYTIGSGGTAVLALLRDHLLPRLVGQDSRLLPRLVGQDSRLLPRLVGQDSRLIEGIWRDLFASTRATTVGAITSLALAAVDTALWDLRCLRAGEPLWRLAGGFRPRVPLYDTEGGWLHLTTEELVAGAKSSAGARFDLMVDANQSMTSAEAIRRAEAFAPVDLFWLEEPMPAEDVSGHQRLAEFTSIPIAVGESMYSIAQFRDYLQRGAASIVQVDVARIGGITPWLKVAHLAETFNVEVCPHFLMELHVSLTAAIPNGRYVEHIPQLRAITTAEMAIEDGHAVAPESPGLGIAWDRGAMDDRRVA